MAKRKVVAVRISKSKVKNTAMASWNGMKFIISSKQATGLTGFEISDSYSDDYNDKGKKVGRDLATFRINVTYFTPVAGKTWGNARAAMQKWRRSLGKSAYLYMGGRKITNRKCRLLSVSVNDVQLTNKGKVVVSNVQLEFRWIRTKAQSAAAIKEAKGTGQTATTKSTKKKNGIKSKKPSPTAIYNGGKMKWPLPGHKRVSSNYGPRNCPFHGRETHSGIDLPAPSGSRINAAAPGTVVFAGNNGSYGKCVIISHGKSIYTLYGHQSSILVHRKQKVKAGQQIGKVGSTGNSTGNHLHFEVRKGGNAHKNHVSPWKYVSK